MIVTENVHTDTLWTKIGLERREPKCNLDSKESDKKQDVEERK